MEKPATTMLQCAARLLPTKVLPLVLSLDGVVCAVALVGGNEIRVVDGRQGLQVLHVWAQLLLQGVVLRPQTKKPCSETE